MKATEVRAPGRLGPCVPSFVEDASTTTALKERGSFLQSKKGQEKEGEIVIYPLEPGLVETARTAQPGVRVKVDRLGLNSRNKEKHDSSLVTFHGSKPGGSFVSEIQPLPGIAFSRIASFPVRSHTFTRVNFLIFAFLSISNRFFFETAL